MKFENETFENVVVQLDENEFVNCTFTDVTLVYAGGPVAMSECRLDKFQFHFAGDLQRGLGTMYELFGTEGMLTIIRGFTEPTSSDQITNI